VLIKHRKELWACLDDEANFAVVFVLDEFTNMVLLLVFVLLEIRDLGDGVSFSLDSQIVDQDCQVAVVLVSVHRDHSVGVEALNILQELSNDSRFACSVALDDSDTFANFKAFPNNESFDSDWEPLLLVCHKGNKPIIDLSDKSI
jgi:hypothetical protein